MSRRNKLEKFAALWTYPNVYENFDPTQPQLTGENGEIVDLKGKWNEKHFQNNNPLILELACGRGEYSLGLARMYPDHNFIGVDVKGARIWQGASIALKEELNNVAFLRTRIEQITNFIGQEEVDEIWITFPDPFLRKSKSNRRLTSPNFLKAYRQILKQDGIVHLKTDSPQLYEFSLEVFQEDGQVNILYQNFDIYSRALDFPELELKTHYERLHLADERKIKYLRFQIH